ncbi:hypothetical protein POF51_26465 [Brevibacillus sp. AG]|uniref:hypothetical protein n=1 Tax=Brevibacillus sp. AG TaxID=3020891 RepID=UPI00232B9811|nr:hypothetical protein [Brevibacillus sp. AG]MDC0764268.1 hypothetical protein [Brevibacillus sp. AG]
MRYGKWTITVLNEKVVEFRDNTKWRTHYINYEMIPAGAQLGVIEIINAEIPDGAATRAARLAEKFHREFFNWGE